MVFYGNVGIGNKIKTNYINLNFYSNSENYVKQSGDEINFFLKPGGNISASINIKNNDNWIRKTTLDLEDVASNDIVIAFSSTNFTINPGESKEVKMVVLTSKDFKGNFFYRLKIVSSMIE